MLCVCLHCSLNVPYSVFSLCFIPKPIGVSLYVGYDTCLVIESGANNTIVTPLVNQEVFEARAQCKRIGGIHISKWLLECIRVKNPMYEVSRTLPPLTNFAFRTLSRHFFSSKSTRSIRLTFCVIAGWHTIQKRRHKRRYRELR